MRFLFLVLLCSQLHAAEVIEDLAGKREAAAQAVLTSALARQSPQASLSDDIELRDMSMFENVASVFSMGVGLWFGEGMKPGVSYQVVEARVRRQNQNVKLTCVMRFELGNHDRANVHVQKCENPGAALLPKFTTDQNVLNSALTSNQRAFVVKVQEAPNWYGSSVNNDDREEENDYRGSIISAPAAAGTR